MNPALKETMLPASPFYSPDGGLDVRGFADTLCMDQATVVSAIGVSRQVVSQHFNTRNKYVKIRNKKAHRFWVKLNQIYSLLLALMDNPDPAGDICEWFNSPNRAFDMERPIDLVRRGELDRISKRLMDVIEGSHGG